jgi:hypothetical protein
MTFKEIKNAITKAKGLNGMTVNERLFATGLIDEFDSCRYSDKEKAFYILDLLGVDKLSIDKILENK